MSEKFIRVITAIALFLSVSTIVMGQNIDHRVVMIDGITDGSDSKLINDFLKTQICPKLDGAVGSHLHDIDNKVKEDLKDESEEVKKEWDKKFEEGAKELGKKIEDFCGKDKKIANFRIIYAHCRMLMLQGSQALSMIFPPGSSEGYLEILDRSTGEAVVQPVNFVKMLREGESPLGGTANDEAPSVTGHGERLGIPVTNYDFSFEHKVLLPGMDSEELKQLAQIAGTMLPKIRNKGNAWIAPNAPGADIVKSFYQTFASAISNSGSNSLLGGLYNHMLLNYGMPLEMTQTTQIVAMGMPIKSNTTHTTAYMVAELTMPSGFCGRRLDTAGYKIVNMIGAPAFKQ